MAKRPSIRLPRQWATRTRFVRQLVQPAPAAHGAGWQDASAVLTSVESPTVGGKLVLSLWSDLDTVRSTSN